MFWKKNIYLLSCYQVFIPLMFQIAQNCIFYVWFNYLCMWHVTKWRLSRIIWYKSLYKMHRYISEQIPFSASLHSSFTRRCWKLLLEWLQLKIIQETRNVVLTSNIFSNISILKSKIFYCVLKQYYEVDWSRRLRQMIILNLL